MENKKRDELYIKHIINSASSPKRGCLLSPYMQQQSIQYSTHALFLTFLGGLAGGGGAGLWSAGR